MSSRIFALFLALSAATGVAQTLSSWPLDLSGLKQTPKTDAQNSDPLSACRVQAEKGDADASFQLGIAYLIGENAPQDAATAERYFEKLLLQSAQMCMIAEAYMETALPGRLDAAERWIEATHAGCADWAQAVWYGGNQRGPDTAKQVAFLRRVLNASDDDYRVLAQAQLGQLLLDGTAITATPAERTAWIGAATRMRLGMAGMLLASRTTANDDPEFAFNWIRRSARYGIPEAMAQLGQAAMARTASDLSYLEGMALYAMGLRQNLLSGATLASQIKQLEPAQIEELHNGIAYWTRIAHETGGYYAKNDPLRLPAPLDEKTLAAQATDADPDAEVRLAYVYEARGDFEKAEALYRTVWRNGLGRILFMQAEEAAKAKQWIHARNLDLLAADFGSREACLVLAKIEAQGLVEKKNPLGEYLWLLRAGSTDTQHINTLKHRLAASEVDSARRSNAAWFLSKKAFWPEETKRAQAILDKQLQIQIPGRGLPLGVQKTENSIDELRRKADAGNTDAAYDLAVRLLWNHPSHDVNVIERYATLGAKKRAQKSHIADGYARSDEFDSSTRRKYAEKWYLAVGGSEGAYELGKLYNGKSDGTVQSEDERTAVAYWQKSVAAGEERWARLARMELGYRVDKGWSSGNRADDARWAHELAMEFLSKELYQVAGEYSYGSELEHNPQTYAYLTERAAIYNNDNAQSRIALSILQGEWKRRKDIDAYAWMKLHAVKQDTGDSAQVTIAEKNPALKASIEARYVQLLKTRATSGAFYPQDDPLRTATATELAPRAAALEPEAQFRLAVWLEQQATPESLEAALVLYRTLWAEAGREVRLHWGRTLLHGTPDIAQDNKGALKWLWDAANAGSHEACNDLAVIYAEGRGVPVDAITAEAWRRLADPQATSHATLSTAEEHAIKEKIDDWRTSHPNW